MNRCKVKCVQLLLPCVLECAKKVIPCNNNRSIVRTITSAHTSVMFSGFFLFVFFFCKTPKISNDGNIQVTKWQRSEVLS